MRDELFQSINDELAFDAWRIYGDDEHRYIPPEVVNGVIIALVTQFLKGTGAFSDLGQATREWLDDLVSRVRSKKNIGDMTSDAHRTAAINSELRKAIEESPKARRGAGVERLKDALRDLGLSEKAAKELALRIAAHFK
jgi:hypothetical protein